MRVYERKFNWDEARRRHADGEPYAVIAHDLGVTYSAVRRVCEPAVNASMRAALKRYAKSGTCPDCGEHGVTPANGCWTNGRCRKCANIARATSVRLDTLQCFLCREWKPDDAFPSNVREVARRGRHSVCRPCQTEEKARWRERHPEKYAAAKRRDWENRKKRTKVAA